MGKLYKRGATYYGDYENHKGQRRRVSLGTQDRQVAKIKLRKLELSSADPATHQTQGLAEALDHLINVAMPAAGRAPGTIHCYKHKARHLARHFGPDATLGDVTRDAVQEYVGVRTTENAASGSIHKELVTLRQAMLEAKSRGLYSGDPKSVIPQYSAKYHPKDRNLSPAELEALIAQLQPARKLWVMVAAFVGVRASEVEGLLWEDVDFGRGWIRVRGTKTKGSYRRVPLLAQLRPWLEAFDTGEGPVVEPWDNCRRDLRVAAKRAGIDKLSPNDLRRTFTSWMKQAGIDSLTVAQMLGHSSTRMVEMVYGRLSEQTYKEAAERCAVFVTKGCSNLKKTDESETETENLKPSQTAPESDLEGFNEVPGDRIELPTRGFSVQNSLPENWTQPPKLKVVSGGKK